MAKPIFIAASPNSERDDVFLAESLSRRPWRWRNPAEVRELEQQVGKFLDHKPAVAFDSARSSLCALLKAYGIGDGDEVIVPGFTCLVVANPIIWTGARPVYVDINARTFRYNLRDLANKVNNRTKAIVVQHTFGIVDKVTAIRKIVGSKVMIIEDLAHSLGGEFQGKKLGTLGDAAIITFGIEKVLSAVRGGVAVSNDPDIAEKLRLFEQSLPKLSRGRVFKSLMNPIIWFLATPLYYYGIGRLTLGRLLIFFGRLFGILGKVIENEEYETLKPKWLPAQMPGALAELALNQWPKLERFNEHRRQIAAIYSRELQVKYPEEPGNKNVYLRFPVFVKDRKKALDEGKKHRVVLGDWYKTMLYAPESSYKKMYYEKDMAKISEQVTKYIINLPTSINVSEEDAKRIAGFIKKHVIK